MLRITKLSDYATLVLATLAKRGSDISSANVLAQLTQLQPSTVNKILKPLARAGLIHSLRGLKGGYRLARAPEDIYLAQIIEAIEGPIALTECSNTICTCTKHRNCAIRDKWRMINQSIVALFQAVSLAQMLDDANVLQVFPPHEVAHCSA